jgi:hypothetical protein
MARKFPVIYHGTRVIVRAIIGPKLRLLNPAQNHASSLFKTQYNAPPPPPHVCQDPTNGLLPLYCHVSEWISPGFWIGYWTYNS